jgi:hypothetical protein
VVSPILHHAGLKQASDDEKEEFVADPARDSGHEDIVVYPVERSLEVRHAFFSRTRRIYPCGFRMTIGLSRPWPGHPNHTGLISAAAANCTTASCTSLPGFRHRLSSDPVPRWAPLPGRMVPVITVHRGLPPPECTLLLDTPGETACPIVGFASFRKSRRHFP